MPEEDVCQGQSISSLDLSTYNQINIFVTLNKLSTLHSHNNCPTSLLTKYLSPRVIPLFMLIHIVCHFRWSSCFPVIVVIMHQLLCFLILTCLINKLHLLCLQKIKLLKPLELAEGITNCPTNWLFL